MYAQHKGENNYIPNLELSKAFHILKNIEPTNELQLCMQLISLIKPQGTVTKQQAHFRSMVDKGSNPHSAKLVP